MFILKKGHQPGVYVPLRALFLVYSTTRKCVHVLPAYIKHIEIAFIVFSHRT